MFFREDFKETPAEIPATQAHIANPEVVLSLYGPGKEVIKKSNHDQPTDDPFYIWSGLCQDNWAVTLKHKSGHVDLSRMGKIKWRSKQSGYRSLHLISETGGWYLAGQRAARPAV